ncbi:hypothetical protein D3C71_1921980 [compost metagenome]
MEHHSLDHITHDIATQFFRTEFDHTVFDFMDGRVIVRHAGTADYVEEALAAIANVGKEMVPFIRNEYTVDVSCPAQGHVLTGGILRRRQRTCHL